MVKNLAQLAITIRTYEKLIRELAATAAFKGMVDRLMEIHGVGIMVAMLKRPDAPYVPLSERGKRDLLAARACA
jgi:hypothetical protein